MNKISIINSKLIFISGFILQYATKNIIKRKETKTTCNITKKLTTLKTNISSATKNNVLQYKIKNNLNIYMQNKNNILNTKHIHTTIINRKRLVSP